MSELFLKIINMSISASWLVLVVLAFRLIFRKAPKWVNVLLWGIVAVRLICPFSIESALSLIPSAETISPEIMMDWTPEISTGMESVDRVVNPIITETFAPEPIASANPLQILIPIFAIIWITGMCILALYTVISYWRLQRKVSEAVILRENIFQSENVGSPFVLGIIKPKIYLPYNMAGQDLEHVVAHERAHIRRKDHLWKPLGFLLLTIHWFNPLMWLAYVLLCRDIELACDEKVIQELGNEQRADYSQALVACSVNRRMIAACPLAFGEVGVKERVKSVLNYKKPAFWVIVVSVIACAAVAVCFLTNPKEPSVFDIFSQDGYVLLDQERVNLTLSVPKDELPNSIYTSEGHEFEKEKVVAYRTNNTTIYLQKAMLSNESDDFLYFYFDFSYDFSNYGDFLSPYSYVADEEDSTVSDLWLYSEDLRDAKTVYPDALSVRGHGPGTQFAFYVSKDACQSAEGDMLFDIACNKIFYAKSGYEDEASRMMESTTIPDKITFRAEILEIRNGYFLVKPENSWALNSADQIEVPMKNMDPSLEPQVGDIIEISYSGEILETYPARLSEVYSIRVVTERKPLSLNDVIMLSQKGYELTWSDFDQYKYIETGSGLYIRVYEINEMFSLWIGGTGLDSDPMYIYLSLADDLDTRIDIRDGGIEEFITKDHSETLLNRAIYDAILDHNLSEKTVGLNNCASFVLLDKEEISGTPVVGSTDRVGIVTVYGLALYQGYDLVNDELREEAGSHIPVAITFDVLNGKYSLKEYWTPRDGTYYAPDIREKFPDHIEDEAMNTQKYIAAQKQECYVQAMRNNGGEVSDPNQQPLSAEELSWFNETFYPIVYDKKGDPIGVNPWSCFFTSYYDDVRNLDFVEFMRYFPGDGSFVSDEEFAALIKLETFPFYGEISTRADMPVPVSRYPARLVNQVLKEYAGITTADLDTSGLEYLPEYDAFYNYTSDFGPGMFTCTRGEVDGDIVRLYEELETGTDMLTLRKVGNGYQIVAHQCIEGDNAAERYYG